MRHLNQGLIQFVGKLNTDELKQKRLHEIEETQRKEQYEKRISEKINIYDPFQDEGEAGTQYYFYNCDIYISYCFCCFFYTIHNWYGFSIFCIFH
jgi:hypothetical protein